MNVSPRETHLSSPSATQSVSSVAAAEANRILKKRRQKLAQRKEERRRLFLGVGLLLLVTYVVSYGYGGSIGLQWWLVVVLIIGLWCMLDRRSDAQREASEKKRQERRERRELLESLVTPSSFSSSEAL